MRAPPAPASDSAPAVSPPRKRRIAAWIAGGVLVPTAALIGALGWLLGTESGLHAALGLGARATGGALEVEGARGRLLGPLRLDAVRYRMPDLTLDVREVELLWQPGVLFGRRLQIDRLAAASVDVARRTAEEPDPGPMEAPASLELPLAVEITRLELGRFALRELDGDLDAGAVRPPEGAPPPDETAPAAGAGKEPVDAVVEAAAQTEAAADTAGGAAAAMKEAAEAATDPAEAADSAADEAAAAGFRFSGLSASLVSDGRTHRLRYLLMTLPQGSIAADAVLGGASPFALDARAAIDASLEGRSVRAQAVLGESLLTPRIELDAQGEGLTARAEAAATPFEERLLRALTLRAGELDPAAFVEGAPRAALRIDAELAAPVAGDTLLAGPIRIDNRQPGTVDAGELPLESFAGRLEWQPAQVSLDELDIRLPGEGRISGRVAWRPPATAGADTGEAGLVDTVPPEAGRAGGAEGDDGPPPAVTESEAAQTAFGQLVAALELSGIDPARLDRRLPSQAVAGRLDAEADALRQALTLALGVGAARIEADAELLAGEQAGAPRSFNLSGQLRDVDPRALLATAPPARLNLDLEASGELPAAGLPQAARLDFRIPPSRFDKLPLEGRGRLVLAGERLPEVDLALDLAGNRLRSSGAFGGAGDRLALLLDAPALRALGYGLGGQARLEGTVSGTMAAPAGEFELFGEALRLPGELRLAGINGAGRLDAGQDGRFDLSLGLSGLGRTGTDADGVAHPDLIDNARLGAEGTRAKHRVELSATGLEDDRVRMVLEGGLRERVAAGGESGFDWVGRLAALETGGRVAARLQAPAELELSPSRVSLGAAEIEAGERGRIRLRETRWSPTETVARGTMSGLALGPLTRADGRPRRGPGPLVLGAEWDLRMADTLDGQARVFRESGDVTLEGEIRTRLGIEALEATLVARGDRLSLSLDGRGTELGRVEGSASVQASRGEGGMWTVAPQAPLSGSARLDMPSITWLGRLMQESVETGGRIAGEISLGGTVGNPSVSGRLSGGDLELALIDQGLVLSGGALELGFDRDRVRLERLAFVSPNRVRPNKRDLPVDALTATPGILSASGEIALDSGDGRFVFDADRLPLLQRPDRWMILSGKGEARSTWTSLKLEADFVADAGYIEFAESPPPSLSDDVVVLGRDDAPKEGGFAVTADVRVRLGEALHLSAMGLETRLAGELMLRARPGLPLAAVGSVSTVGGVFRGYGQNLTIDRGVVNFQGPLDNPGLNVVALRKGLAVEAGVAVTGSARRPMVKLVSQPNVPDPEKLSWLVLGRAPDAGSGADLGLLLPAAQALFGGPGGGMTDQLSRSLGFDTFSIGQGELGSTSHTATSSVVGGGSRIASGPTVGGSVLSLGKRLDTDLFLSFEQSLGGAETLVKLSYQLSRRLALILRGGTDNSVDLEYGFSFR